MSRRSHTSAARVPSADVEDSPLRVEMDVWRWTCQTNVVSPGIVFLLAGRSRFSHAESPVGSIPSGRTQGRLCANSRKVEIIPIEPLSSPSLSTSLRFHPGLPDTAVVADVQLGRLKLELRGPVIDGLDFHESLAAAVVVASMMVVWCFEEHSEVVNGHADCRHRDRRLLFVTDWSVCGQKTDGRSFSRWCVVWLR